MHTNDKKILTVSVFSDEEQNRKSNMLQLSSAILLLGAIGGIIIFITSGDFYLILAFSFMLIGALASMILLRFGHMLFASWILLLSMLASLIFVIYLADGIHDMIILLFPISILIASMLLDKRGLIAYSLAVFLSMHIFIICEMTGIISNRMSQFTSFLDLISVGIIMTISILLSYMMSNVIARGFSKVNHINELLRSELAERQKMEIEIQTKVDELERYKKTIINRELKMVELKEKINMFEQKVMVQQ